MQVYIITAVICSVLFLICSYYISHRLKLSAKVVITCDLFMCLGTVLFPVFLIKNFVWLWVFAVISYLVILSMIIYKYYGQKQTEAIGISPLDFEDLTKMFEERESAVLPEIMAEEIRKEIEELGGETGESEEEIKELGGEKEESEEEIEEHGEETGESEEEIEELGEETKESEEEIEELGEETEESEEEIEELGEETGESKEETEELGEETEESEEETEDVKEQSTKPVNVEDLIDSGFAAKSRGSFHEAAELFVQALDLRPAPDLAYYLIIDAYDMCVAAGDPNRIIRRLNQYCLEYKDTLPSGMKENFEKWLKKP